MVAVTWAAYLAWSALPRGVMMRTGTWLRPVLPASTTSKGPTANATR